MAAGCAATPCGAALAHRGHQIKRIVLVPARGGRSKAALSLQVIDSGGAHGRGAPLRRRDRPVGGLHLFAEPARLVIDRQEGLVRKVEAPRRLSLAPAGGEGQHDRPGTTLGPPGVPASVLGVHAATLESFGHPC